MLLFLLHTDLRSLTPRLCFYPQLVVFDYFTQFYAFIADTARLMADIFCSVRSHGMLHESKLMYITSRASSQPLV